MILERDGELAEFDALIDAARAGAGGLAVLEGPAGIGKTELLRATAERSRAQGVAVLSASGDRLERDFPFGVVRALYEPVLAGASVERRVELLSGAAGLAAPALGFDQPGESPPDVGGSSFAALHGLYWLSSNLAAERPVLIAVDDAHWADAPSLRWLAYLGRRLEGLPILLVLAVRSGEAGADSELLTAILAQPCARVIAPAPLSEAATGNLIGVALGAEPEPEFACACRRASGGNPFLVRQLASALAADGVIPRASEAGRVRGLGPGTVARALVLRLAHLPAASAKLAQAVAVLGGRVDLSLAAALAGCAPAAADEAADALARVGILEDGRPLGFVHPIVQAAIYEDIGAGRRARLHAQAAHLLEGAGAEPARIAAHLLATEPTADPWVVQMLRAAAWDARGRGAPDAAVAYLSRGLEEPPPREQRLGVVRELGSAGLRAARPDAVAHLREAFDGAPDDAARAVIVGELALALAAAGRAREGVEVLEAAITGIGSSDRDTALRLEALLAGTMQMELETARRLPQRLSRYDGRLHGRTAAERLVLANLAAQLAFQVRAADRVVEIAEVALGDGRLLDEQEPDGQSFYMAVSALVYAGHFKRAVDLFGLAVDEARSRGSMFGFAIASAGRCWALWRAGSFLEAEADGWAAHEVIRAHGGHPGLRTIVAAYVLPVLIERTDIAACEAFVADTGADGELPPQTICNAVLHARGHLRLAAGDAGAALHDFEELQRRDVRWGMKNPAAWPTRSSSALAHLQLGERDEARRLAGHELRVARRWGVAGVTACALRAAAAAEGGAGAIELLRESVTAAAGSEARGEYARSLIDLGAALRRAGHPRDARGPLAEGLELADRCGAQRLASRAREELVTAGARPRRIRLSGVESLTASERRIAQMASAGMSNRKIAQALFVSIRTVETHLGHVYKKLDLRSREALGSALGDASHAGLQEHTLAGEPAVSAKDT